MVETGSIHLQGQSGLQDHKQAFQHHLTVNLSGPHTLLPEEGKNINTHTCSEEW